MGFGVRKYTLLKYRFFECVTRHKAKNGHTMAIASCPYAAKSIQACRSDIVFLALYPYLHSSYEASTMAPGVYKELVGSCFRVRSLGEISGGRGRMDQRGCYGNGLEVDQLVILSRRKHTDPRWRVALRRPKHRCTKNTPKRESATDRSAGMVNTVWGPGEKRG